MSKIGRAWWQRPERPRKMFIADFKSLFNMRFPSSLRTCQLRFKFWKLGVKFLHKKSLQVHLSV